MKKTINKGIILGAAVILAVGVIGGVKAIQPRGLNPWSNARGLNPWASVQTFGLNPWS